MELEHIVHVTSLRPDIANLIALPPGFAFQENGREVDFDQEAYDEGLEALKEIQGDSSIYTAKAATRRLES